MAADNPGFMRCRRAYLFCRRVGESPIRRLLTLQPAINELGYQTTALNDGMCLKFHVSTALDVDKTLGLTGKRVYLREVPRARLS